MCPFEVATTGTQRAVWKEKTHEHLRVAQVRLQHVQHTAAEKKRCLLGLRLSFPRLVVKQVEGQVAQRRSVQVDAANGSKGLAISKPKHRQDHLIADAGRLQELVHRANAASTLGGAGVDDVGLSLAKSCPREVVSTPMSWMV